MRASVFGVDTNYQIIGKGPSLVLLHGWGCNWEVWYPIISELSKTHTLIIPDLPAFGESKLHSNEWNSHHYVSWLDAFINKTVGENKFALLGHSFGGKVAALYAAEFHTKQLKKLILVDISGLPVPLPLHKVFQERLLSILPNQLKSIYLGKLKSKILLRFGATDYANASEQQKAIFKLVVKENISALVTQITTPTTLIWGSEDKDTPLEQGKKLHQLIPNSQFELFHGAGHFPFIEQPVQFIKILKKYL